MNENQMDTYVRQRFGMGLYEFMKQKLEEESFFNYEVADLLDVDPQSISMWRRAFGLRRGNVFLKRFENKYGKGAVDTFKKLAHEPENTLADVGRHFGFTREYARQAYFIIFGKSYTKTHEKKVKVRRENRQNIEVPNEPPEIFKKVSAKMKTLGLESEYIYDNKKLRISVNGYRASIRFCTRPFVIGKKQYYRIIFDCCEVKRDFDFCVCVLKKEDKDIYYIIPSGVLPKRSIALCPDVKEEKSKYSRFKEAWNFLSGSRYFPADQKRNACSATGVYNNASAAWGFNRVRAAN
ncbi:MAG: hypothetical protein PVG39_01750 [Desulfobacteraceae bacterium]|jgi:hypothetical protein